MLAPSKFKYKKRPPFFSLLQLAEYALNEIDRFVEVAYETQQKNLVDLKKLEKGINPDDDIDWLEDVFEELNDFKILSSEFGIIGLWRCIELFNKSAVRIALGPDAAKSVFRHEEFKKNLLKLHIDEKKIRCSKSIDELRCLNNAIKHERKVDDHLSKFNKWRTRKGERLGDLDSHYKRLRPLSERYLRNLTNRMNFWWKKNKSSSTPLP